MIWLGEINMKHRDWFLAGDGQCKPCETVNEWKLLRENYRLYRFLTELEDMLPWERDVYVGLLSKHIKEENERIERENKKRG